MGPDALLLTLRFGFAILLYLFLLAVLLSVRRDLRLRASSDPLVEASPATVPVARLIVVQAGRTGLKAGDAVVLKSPMTLGRGQENALVLPDSTVSTVHARIGSDGDGWWIEDQGSTNGTRVGGRRVGRRVRLDEGDLVDLGGVRFQVRLGERRS